MVEHRVAVALLHNFAIYHKHHLIRDFAGKTDFVRNHHGVVPEQASF